MKKILTLACLFAAFSASAQLLFRAEKTQFSGVFTSQNSLTDKPNIFYIELSVGTTKSANDVEIYTGVVDVGDLKGWFLADSTGNKPLKFNSPIDVFNYLHAQGWEFISTVEDTRSTALWGKLFFDVTTVRTQMTYIFRRQRK
jgi:hypothetical protein